jgi:hypothetical protein
VTAPVRLRRRHPYGPACSADDQYALYFDELMVSEEYRRRQESGVPFSKTEVSAVARVAVQIAVQRGDLPEEALRVKLNALDAIDCDAYVADYLVIVDCDDVNLCRRIYETVGLGLTLINAVWQAEEPATGDRWEIVAYHLGEDLWTSA